MTADTPTARIPARIVNEHCYCPRLAYLMWVDGANADNAATIEGTAIHHRVDARAEALPEDDGRPAVRTSLTLGDDLIGVVARIDLIELDGATAVPVEYKRGKPNREDQPLWEPELLQLYAQALLLRAHGYDVDHAAVWFAGSRQRVDIPVPSDATEQVLRRVSEIRGNAEAAVAPPPLVDSPKCPHCVLIGLCLPDESSVLRGDRAAAPRRLMAPSDPSQPLYVTEPGVTVGKRGGRLALRSKGVELSSVRLLDVAHIAVFGNGTVTSGAVRACAEAQIPIVWMTSGGWLTAVSIPTGGADTRRRIAQTRAHLVGDLQLCRAFVAGKVRNCRTLLRRLGGETAAPVVTTLKSLMISVEEAESTATLLGLEGTAARIYFSAFETMLRAPLGTFDFEHRNRRPPRDPVNAALSFTYALLAKDATLAALAAGLDPYVGLYHRPGFARPALALDLMEEFRPLICDSTVVRAVNNGEIRESDFLVSRAGTALTARGRKAMLGAYERRMSEELLHPVYGYRSPYRRCLEIQARMLAAKLVGDVDVYRPLTTR